VRGALRQAEDVPDQLLAHLSPLGWEHVNLTGDYIWSAERPAAENSDGFRPLRAAPDPTRKAAGNGALEVSRVPQDDCGDEKVQPGSGCCWFS
jgi:Tn3 transposase DDE domain